ncbi:MAG: BON domain-containing protein [Planctomycetales bacterium]|nr:BON domain-containing protein [Planctomycetales bacterium]
MSLILLSPTEKTHSCLTSSAKQLPSPEALVPLTRYDDVQSRAQASLRGCPYREVQKTTCLFHKGVLLLRGEVSSYYLKQIAQTVLMNVEGVNHIVNTIHVRTADASIMPKQA